MILEATELLIQTYQSAQPFAHIVLDHIFELSDLMAAANELETMSVETMESWIHYQHANENVYGTQGTTAIPPATAKLIEQMHAPEFIRSLEKLTGFENLLADKDLAGGGLLLTPAGGYMNLHTDYLVHPYNKQWRRRLNVLLYLNPDWREEYGGELEFWDPLRTKCHVRIAPQLGRLVIFSTAENTIHGYPRPVRCPPGQTRKVLSLWYYTDEGKTLNFRPTIYRSRPEDSLKTKLLIVMDNFLIRAYWYAKRLFKIDDRLANWIMRLFKRS